MKAALYYREFRDRGAALVDAAIVFPILILVVFGVVQMGYIITAYITLRNASAAGARVGVVESDLANTNRTDFNTKVSDAVVASIAPLDSANLTVPAPVVSVDIPPKITVTVNYSLPLFPGSRLVLGQTGNFAMTTSTTMR